MLGINRAGFCWSLPQWTDLCNPQRQNHWRDQLAVAPTIYYGLRSLLKYCLPPTPSPKIPIIGNPHSLMEFYSGDFFNLHYKKFTQAIHFLTNSSWTTILELMSELGRYRLTFWPVVQLRNVFSLTTTPNILTCSLTPQPLCTLNKLIQHTLFLTYSKLINSGEDFVPFYLT